MNVIIWMFIIAVAVATVTNIVHCIIINYIAKRKIQRDIIDAYARVRKAVEEIDKLKEKDK